jgi:hypothetical protein
LITLISGKKYKLWSPFLWIFSILQLLPLSYVQIFSSAPHFLYLEGTFRMRYILLIGSGSKFLHASTDIYSINQSTILAGIISTIFLHILYF